MTITTKLPPRLISIEDISRQEGEDSPCTPDTASEPFGSKVFPTVYCNPF